jgi:ABC-type uncharacterized transport system YnjBCD permease subunit
MLIGQILVGIATAAVAVVLMIGLYSLYRGGEFARTHSNRLMRLRVLLQAIAILVIMTVLFFTSRSHGGP